MSYLEGPFDLAIKELKDKFGNNRFRAVDFRNAIEQHVRWDDQYTTEQDLLVNLVLPLTKDKYKTDPFIVRNQMAMCSYRYYMFSKSGFDYFLCYSATEGKAKSTLAMHSISQLKELGIRFDWNEHIYFRGTPVNKAIYAINYFKDSVLWFDEAKAYFEKRESMDRKRIKFLQDITAQRKNRNIYKLLIGDWEELDIYFRERRLREVILVVDKGIFMPFFNTSILGIGDDRFFLEQFKHFTRLKPLNYTAQINFLLKLPSNMGIGTFPPITGNSWDYYISLKEDFNKRFLVEREKKKDEYFDDLDSGDSSIEMKNLHSFLGSSQKKEKKPKAPKFTGYS